jgi:protein involved in polysaccharide export with SLBB domain
LLIALTSGGVLAQDRDYVDHTRAISESDSRAEQEAEQVVSLPPEKIILLLEHEPGLALEVRKMLVRKAYQQGRILDPKDLTDDALFRLIRKDETVRVLITQQIVDRQYIRAKPTREELARQLQQRQTWAAANARTSAGVRGTNSSSQEDNYWTQQKQLPQGSPQYANPSGQPLPQTQPEQTPEETTPTIDQRRQLLQAQAQSSSGDLPQGLPLDVLGMQPVQPDELGGVLTPASQSSSSIGPAGQSGPGALPGGDSGMSDLESASGGVPSASDLNLGAGQNPEEASLQRSQRPIPGLRTYPRQDRPALLHRADPYADVPSLYDLYAQYSMRSPVLMRFGSNVFTNGTGNFDRLPMDLPVGPDYVLGPGDGVNIDLWGSFSQRLHRTVDREGRLSLPEVGSVQVSGRTMGDVQHTVQAALRTQLRGIEADLSLARLRTIRIYVVGDVLRPGAYDVSSLSTPLNALYQAGGPTSRGSMRIVKHYRGSQLVENVDLYELLLHGVQAGMQRLESGDTILVPPAGEEVTISGMVRRPAIYELDGEKNLAEVLQLAGGVLPSGTLRHVDVERVQAHLSRTMLALNIPENNNQESVTEALENFNIQDGDKIKISPILPFANQTVYLDGHVFRPGKYAYHDGMKVTDLIASYKDLLPEPYQQHAEIIRLSPPDYKPEILSFNLADALTGKTQDVTLKPFDTVRVFGRFDFEDPPVITVSGAVRDPGDHVTNGATYLRDAVFLAGNTTPDANLTDAQIFRQTNDGKLEVLSVNLSKALAGDARDNILLQPKDRVFIHKDLSKSDPATVTIQGEVARPGRYPLGINMSAADLVRLAGGLKRSAYTTEADLTHYLVEDSNHVEGEHVNIQLAQALAGEPDADARLHDGDVLTIRQVTGWNNIGATITIEGEVVHPGTYGIQDGERLSSVLRRAGGFSSDAYAYGAILERSEVRELEEKNRSELIQQVQQEGAGLQNSPDDPVTKAAYLTQWKSALDKLQQTPPTGRLVIHISGNVKQWMNGSSDVQVRAGDSLFIPKHPNFVMIEGAVYNQTAITFKPGKSANYYLQQAGGPTTIADKKGIFVIRGDGSVVGGKGGLFNGGALDAALQPGDLVVVPDKALGGGLKWRQTLQVSELVSSIGIAVQVARGF